MAAPPKPYITRQTRYGHFVTKSAPIIKCQLSLRLQWFTMTFINHLIVRGADLGPVCYT